MRRPFKGRARPERWWLQLLFGSGNARALRRRLRGANTVSVDLKGAITRALKAPPTPIVDRAIDAVVASCTTPPPTTMSVFDVSDRHQDGSLVDDAAFAKSCAALLDRIVRETQGAPGERRVRFRVPAIALAARPAQLITDIIDACLAWSGPDAACRAGRPLADVIADNLCRVSGVSRGTADENPRRLVYPDAAKSPTALVEAYLHRTPFASLLLDEVTFGIGDAECATSCHIVAAPGWGKTSAALEHIAFDLLSRQTQVSLVAIDSQGEAEFLTKIGRLKLFAPGQRRFGDLVRISANDVVAMNPIALARANPTHAVDLLNMIFGDIFDSALTDRQQMVFTYVIRLMCQVPGADLRTLMAALRDRTPFGDSIDTLDDEARRFFAEDMETKQYRDSCEELRRRLQMLLAHPMFAKMLGAREGRFDFARELNAGRVVLVDTARSELGSASPLLGRLVIAMTVGALLARSKLAEAHRTPTYLLIDEAMEYFASADALSLLLSQARKFKGGAFLSHQNLSQIKTLELRRALTQNVGVQLIGGAEAMAARELSVNLGLPEALLASLQGARRERPVAEFAFRAKAKMATAAKVRIPIGALQHAERMSEAEWDAVRAESQRRYGVSDKPATPTTDDAQPPSRVERRKTKTAASRASEDDDWLSGEL